MSRSERPAPVVLDTNVLLDLLVFDDPSTHLLKREVEGGSLSWLATPPMRDELQRVLTYPHIAARMVRQAVSESAVLAWFDRYSQPQPPPEACAAICRDKDDQKFIDLAVAHGALLLSKDDAVLRLRKRMVASGARVQSVFTPAT